MATSTPSSATSPSSLDSRPLLFRHNPSTNGNGNGNGGASSQLALLIGRATGRQSLREPSVAVREAAALQLEERRADWGYSKPVVALDIAWNLVFFAASVAILASSTHENPPTPVRLWICGYALQCLLHVIFVWAEFRRRERRRLPESVAAPAGGAVDSGEDESGEDEVAGGGGGFHRTGSRISIAKRFESINTMVSFFWWIVGFYWVVAGGEALMHNAPRLYWLAVVFLAFDVLFAIFCVALACIIGIALCCCLPCIIAILYAVAGQEGASDADINILPRYRFSQAGSPEKPITGSGTMTALANATDERVISSDEAECCICLSPYEDGVEINALPCNHHFHSTCIVKWLRINATCPLCKYNILKGDEQV
ncbi:E3 ubiquitin protein ligase RIE1 [Amborella trichopoda]|uniref:E3 ubiquitin protein ligase RIE1 n=1 Tax=Amborella trichopoda TaxID=13333 RepID=UPI0005D44F59|nr:E3 ubiquitin protein ligase RIE1 [Amborella trichopoda]|eukprot:XP_011628069.1 E3 ubiquitin protein ligase RIE1 [Amborella trichopoda]